MGYIIKPFSWCGTATLGGRIYCDPLRMYFFCPAQFSQQLVKFIIADHWIIQNMIAIVMEIDLVL